MAIEPTPLCPRCLRALVEREDALMRGRRCVRCGGCLVTVEHVRSQATPEFFAHFVAASKQPPEAGLHPCPRCHAATTRVRIATADRIAGFEHCRACASLWTTRDDLRAIPLSERHRSNDDRRLADVDDSPSLSLGQWLLVLIGLPVEQDAGWRLDRPWVTWSTAAVIAVASLLAFSNLDAFDPRSDLRCVGASGGISGVLAFYAFAFPGRHIYIGLPLFAWWHVRSIRWFHPGIGLAAFWAFALWAVLQLLLALQQLAGLSTASGLAHLGGVIVGVLAWLRWQRRSVDPGPAARG